MYNTVLFCAEAFTYPTHLHKEHDFVMCVYNTIQFGPKAYTSPTHLQKEPEFVMCVCVGLPKNMGNLIIK